MGYKKMSTSLTSADLALESSLKHNRSLNSCKNLILLSTDHVTLAFCLPIIPLAPVIKALILIRLYYCSNACCRKNGFASNPILNWKTKLMTGFLSNDFSAFLLINRLRTTLLSLGFDPDCLKMPWLASIPKSYASLKPKA